MNGAFQHLCYVLCKVIYCLVCSCIFIMISLYIHGTYYIVIYSCIYFSATTLYVLLSLLCLKHICNIFIINYDGLIFSLFLFVFKADIDYIYIHQYKKMISLLYNIVLTCRARILECYSVQIQIKASLLVIHRLSWAFKSFQLYFNYIVTSGFNWGNQDRT
jgi:hypothetical protein